MNKSFGDPILDFSIELLAEIHSAVNICLLYFNRTDQVYIKKPLYQYDQTALKTYPIEAKSLI